MFAVTHSDINSLKSGHLHLTGQVYRKKGKPSKVKDGIRNLILKNYLIDPLSCGNRHLNKKVFYVTSPWDCIHNT